MKKTFFATLFLFLAFFAVKPVFAVETITSDIGTTTPNSNQSIITSGCVYQSFVASTSFLKVTRIGFVTSNSAAGTVTFRVGIATSTFGCTSGVYTDSATSTGWLGGNYIDVVNTSANSTSTVTVYDIPDTDLIQGTTYYAKICGISATGGGSYRIVGYSTNVDASSSYINVNSTGNCNNISRDVKLTVWQDGTAPASCTSWAYTGWGDCASDNNQWRSVIASYPSGCSGGSPVLSQPCVYNALIASTSVASANYNQLGFYMVESCVSTSTSYCLQTVRSAKLTLNFFDVLFLSLVLAMPFLLYFLYKRLKP